MYYTYTYCIGIISDDYRIINRNIKYNNNVQISNVHYNSYIVQSRKWSGSRNNCYISIGVKYIKYLIVRNISIHPYKDGAEIHIM